MQQQQQNCVKMMDPFFDCLNVCSTTEYQRKRKPFLAPYTSVNDQRFVWLKNDSLGYLRDWKESIANHPGEFSNNEAVCLCPGKPMKDYR